MQAQADAEAKIAAQKQRVVDQKRAQKERKEQQRLARLAAKEAKARAKALKKKPPTPPPAPPGPEQQYCVCGATDTSPGTNPKTQVSNALNLAACRLPLAR